MISGQQPQAPFHSASLYVGDLSPDVTEALLFEIFNAVGPVASIRVCRDAVTRRSLGYAYVNFHNVADAERALDTMNYTTIKGKTARIMWSQRDPSLRKSGVGNVFVKNLHTSIDNKVLFDTFSLFGNILSCKVATELATGTSKGYGYVHYETAEAATAAIEKANGMEIEGLQVFVGHFTRRGDRSGVSEWTNVYAKNLPLSWDDSKLREVFAAYGEVTSALVMKGKPRVKEGEEAPAADGELVSRGFGFVNFATPAAAAAAVEALNGRSEEGKELYVGRAQKRGEREAELRSRFAALKSERLSKYSGVNLYIKNLDDSIADDRLRTEFAPYGTITSARVMTGEGGRSRGFGFVCFSSPEEAAEAVKGVNGKLMEGKPVYVALAQRAEVRRAELEASHAQQRVALRHGMPIPGMYGAAPMFYPGGPAGLPGRGGFVYPQGGMMMPRGPRGPMPSGYRPGAYQMPAYGVPLPAGAAPRGPRGAPLPGRGGAAGPRPTARTPPAGGAPRGVPTGVVPPGGAPGGGGRNFKYTANARNQPGMVPVPIPMPAPVPAMPVPGMMEPLSAATLAAASPEMQKNLIGERLYPLVAMQRPELAGKITGMLLEMDNGELLHLLESPEDMAAKVALAVQVLNEAAEAQA